MPRALARGLCAGFALRAPNVLLADVDESRRCVAVADECGAEFVRLDVSSEQAWSALTEKVRADYGHLDVMVNNAGIVSNADIMTVDVATWNQLLSINLTGMMLGCQTAIALMRDNPAGSQGSIVNTASSTSYLAIPDVAYTTSKAGVVGLTKSVAVACANAGLTDSLQLDSSRRNPHQYSQNSDCTGA